MLIIFQISHDTYTHTHTGGKALPPSMLHCTMHAAGGQAGDGQAGRQAAS